VLFVKLAHPAVNVFAVVGTELLEQAKILRSEFFEGFHPSTLGGDDAIYAREAAAIARHTK
jgi:hypothetical protein